MELILHKVCGHPAQQAVTLRRCTPDEAPAVYALQNEVHAAMPHPEWFVTDTLEHITGYITDSLCIGVWQGSRLCGFSGCAAGRVAPLGQCRQRCGAPGLAGQRPAAPHAGSCPAASAGEHHAPGSHGQSGQSLQSEQRPGLRVHHPCPPRNVRWVRPLPAGKGAVKRKELLHFIVQQLFVVYNAVGAGWKLTAAR